MLKSRSLPLIVLALLTSGSLFIAIFIFLGGLKLPPAIIPPTLPVSQSNQALHLTVLETGVVALEMTKIREMGLPLDSFSADTLSLLRDGQPVPFFVQGEGKDSVLYFYAQAITDTLEAPAVYWLTPGLGVPMRQADATPELDASTAVAHETHRWEENKVFLAQSDGNDLWLGQLIFAPTSLDIPLSGVRATAEAGVLTVRIWSNNQAPANPDHHLEVALNGRQVAEEYWEGIMQMTIEVELPAGILQAENNVLTLTAAGDTGAAGEQLYLDWIGLTFESLLDVGEQQLHFRGSAGTITLNGLESESIILDVTDPTNPIYLTGAKFERKTTQIAGTDGRQYQVLNPNQAITPQISLVPQRPSLTEANRGANYIAIVAEVEGFEETLQPLLDYRRTQGLNVTSVPISQIFDEFAYGRQTPQAIRDFLAYAVANWDPAPHFVLLVGDANYDIYNHTNGKNPNLIPTYLVNTHFAGYVASDTWYTLLEDGELSPSLAIGRFPAQNKEQLANMVNKTIAYEQNAAGTDWVKNALLVADDEPNFNTASDRLHEELSKMGYQTQKLYMLDNDDTDYNHDRIFSALNQGVGIVNYVGHGSIEVWGDEKVLQADDAGNLANRDRLPIFTTFTCLNGYFNHPQVDALAETLLWARDGGIVAAVAPSGRTTTSQQVPLADQFYSSLLNGQALTLGEALQIAKISASANDNLRDVIHTFNLLGDPALRFQRPPAPASQQ